MKKKTVALPEDPPPTKWARKLIKDLQAKKSELQKDPRNNPHYWNGDIWGGMDGHRDADEWLERQLVNFVLDSLEELKKLEKSEKKG